MTRVAPALSRSRRVARWLLLLGLLVLLFATIATVWLLRSGGGRDFALARVLAALPADSLRWERAEGSVGGPLVLHGVHYTQDGVRIEARRVSLDLAPMAAFSRTLRIDALQIDGLRITLPPEPEPEPPSPWPERLELPVRLPRLQAPFALQLEALEVRGLELRRREEPLFAATRLEAAGALREGRLVLQRARLESDRGDWQARADLDSAADWAGEASLEGAWPVPDAALLPISVRYSGRFGDVQLRATAQLEPQATLEATLRRTANAPEWTLRLQVPRLDPARFGADGVPLAIELDGVGTLAEATLQGQVVRGDEHWVLRPSLLRYADTTLSLAPLDLQTPWGGTRTAGTIALGGTEPVYALRLTAPELRWSAGADRPEVQAAIDAELEGPRHDHALRLHGTLRRAEQEATLALRGRGDGTGLQFEDVALRSAQGSLQGRGALAWSPLLRGSLDAALSRFDPSWWLPDWPGAVDGRIAGEFEQRDDGPHGWLQARDLGGTLRARALRGEVRVHFAGDARGDAQADLRLGESHLLGEARWDDTIDATLRLQPLQLADLLPDAAGTLQGRIALQGARDAPRLEAELAGRALAAFGVSAEALTLSAGRDAQGETRSDLQLTQPAWGAQRFESLRLLAAGRAEAHQLTLTLDGAPADVRVRLAGGYEAPRWRGTLQELRLAPAERAPLQLQAPAAFAFERDRGVLTLARTCLSDGVASLCAHLDHEQGRSEAEATLTGFPLATFDPLLAAQLELPVQAQGEVSGQARFERVAQAPWRGTLRLASSAGNLRLDPEAPRELFAYRDFLLEGELDASELRVNAGAGIGGEGRAELELRSSDPRAEDGALEGRVTLALRDLRWLELASDRLVSPQGRIDAALALGGSRRAPTLAGEATLAGFSGEVPELGIVLRDGGLRLRSNGARVAQLEGELTSGGGTLRLAGDLDLRDEAQERITLRLRGADFAAAALPELGAVVTPDLTLVRKPDRWVLGGHLDVPSANVNLERLESATQPSSDVVVVDEERSERRQGDALFEADVELRLGDKVRLQGFGLKGRLEGQLAVRDRPGRATVARGGLQVSGEYKAYGQDLEITRGRLAYASTPLDDPALDVRAQREIDDVTVGVQVRGSARQPELSLWSNPALDQAEQLSYLVLGRPMRSATQADGARLNQAAAAFGGNLLAQKLGARMGLDEVGVSDSRALGGAALTVGKYLSPRLYVSYGVALFDSGQVVTFKYLINRLWNVQIDSGSENRAAINYRLER